MWTNKAVVFSVFGLVAVALVAAGCGSDSADGSNDAGGSSGSAGSHSGGSSGSAGSHSGGSSGSGTSTGGSGAAAGADTGGAGGSAGSDDSAGAGGASDVDGFSTVEWDAIKQLGPLGAVPPDPTNKYADNAAAATFGQKLFFEKGYSGALTVGNDGTNGSLGAVNETGKVACASCHDPSSYYSDTRSHPNALSLGVKWTSRNAPPLVNVAFYKWWSWGGKEDSLWYQGANGSESAANFGGNRLQFAHLIYDKYRVDYNAIFPIALDPALDSSAPNPRFPASGKPKAAATDADGAWEMMTQADRDLVNLILANTGKAIAAYERLLVSRNAPIDQYIGGDYAALTASAKRGLKLFIGKAGCVSCHSGTSFTDQQFHNTGVPQQVGANVPATDNGRFDDLTKTLTNTFNGAGKFSDDQAAGAAKLAGMTPSDDLKGKFRTSALRNIDKSGPYTHNGSFATLDALVHFYNMGGAATGFAGTKDPLMVPLDLSAGDETDLVEFLKSLTGDAPPAVLGTDTSVH